MNPKDRIEINFKKQSDRNKIVMDDYDRFKPVLYNNLYVPSYVHSYSLAIEYMKQWFLDKFDKGFFKYEHINGKHMFDDYKRFNKQNVKREKPLCIITPNIEYDHDRETIDLYQAPPEVFLKRSDFQKSFFKDTDSRIFLAFQMKELRMNFNFRVKVSTRAQQLDLLEKMNLRFRIGATSTEYRTAEFVLPKDVLVNIAEHKGFKIENGEIKEPTLFLEYLNSHSQIPIIYKLRNINNRLEYFMRLDNIFCNIWTTNKIQVDDGEREGMIDNNFNLDLEATLRMSVPHFFVYFDEKPLTFSITTDNSPYGFYTLSQFTIEPKNQYNWDTFMNTVYQIEAKESTIDFTEVLRGTDLEKVIQYNISNHISPTTFIDIKVYKELGGEYPMVYSDMDYTTSVLTIQPQLEQTYLYIVIYIDKLYFNERLEELTRLSGNSRI